MDMARIKILSSVPIVMAINLALLNHFCGKPLAVDANSNKKSSSYEYYDDYSNNNSYKVPKPVVYNSTEKRKVLRYPPPPAHTLVGYNPSENTSDDKIKTNGVIIK